MEENKSNYYVLNNLYQAQALSYLGFRYQKHTDKYTGNTQYTFERSDDLLEAINDIKTLKAKYRKY